MTIPGSALDMSDVYVYAGTGFPETTAIQDDNEEVGRALPATGTTSATITITYLGPPVRMAPDGHGLQTDDQDDNPEPRSHLAVGNNTIPNTAAAIEVTATQ